MAAAPSQSHSQADRFLLVAILALAAFPLLLLLRRFDDNTLTSWRWAAAAADPGKVFLLQAAGVAGAYLLSRSFPLGKRTGFFLFTWAALTASLFWSLPELVIDASRYFTQAKHLEVHGVHFFLREWGREIDAWTDMPLMPFLYGLIFRYLGESRVYVQLLHTVLFAGTVVATFHAGRVLWEREAGFYAALFLLAVPYLHTQVPLMLTDVPAMFLVTLSLLASLTALSRGGYWLLAPAPAVVLTALVKYSTWPLLAAGLPLAVLAASCRTGLAVAVGRAAALSVVPGLLLGAFALWKQDVILRQIALLTDFQWEGLSWWQESHVSTFLFQVHPFATLLALFSAGVALRKRDRTLLLPLGLVALLIGMGVERARYLLVVFPMVAMAGGYGLRSVGSPRLNTFTAYCAVLSSLVVSAFFYRPFLMSVSLGNLKEAGALLNSRGAESAEVFTLPPNSRFVNPAVSVPLLDLYYSGKIAYVAGGRSSPEEDAVRRSPFRFSWQYRNPEYYAGDRSPPGDTAALVVISGDADPPLPPALAQRAALLERHALTRSSGVYRFRTLVTLYLPGRR